MEDAIATSLRAIAWLLGLLAIMLPFHMAGMFTFMRESNRTTHKMLDQDRKMLEALVQSAALQATVVSAITTDANGTVRSLKPMLELVLEKLDAIEQKIG